MPRRRGPGPKCVPCIASQVRSPMFVPPPRDSFKWPAKTRAAEVISAVGYAENVAGPVPPPPFPHVANSCPRGLPLLPIGKRGRGQIPLTISPCPSAAPSTFCISQRPHPSSPSALANMGESPSRTLRSNIFLASQDPQQHLFQSLMLHLWSLSWVSPLWPLPCGTGAQYLSAVMFHGGSWLMGSAEFYCCRPVPCLSFNTKVYLLNHVFWAPVSSPACSLAVLAFGAKANPWMRGVGWQPVRPPPNGIPCPASSHAVLISGFGNFMAFAWHL